MILFQSAPGSVIKLADPAAQCSVKILGVNPSITFDNQLSLITRMTLSQAVNVQFLHTLGAQIFIYVFGDRMGQISLSGLSFICGCDTEDDDTGIVGQGNFKSLVGPEQLLLWFRQNRCSSRASPVTITIGSTPIEGFVTSFNEDVIDPAVSLTQWSVTLAALPDQSLGSSTVPITSITTPFAP